MPTVGTARKRAWKVSVARQIHGWWSRKMNRKKGMTRDFFCWIIGVKVFVFIVTVLLWLQDVSGYSQSLFLIHYRRKREVHGSCLSAAACLHTVFRSNMRAWNDTLQEDDFPCQTAQGSIWFFFWETHIGKEVAGADSIWADQLSWSKSGAGEEQFYLQMPGNKSEEWRKPAAGFTGKREPWLLLWFWLDAGKACLWIHGDIFLLRRDIIPDLSPAEL